MKPSTTTEPKKAEKKKKKKGGADKVGPGGQGLGLGYGMPGAQGGGQEEYDGGGLDKVGPRGRGLVWEACSFWCHSLYQTMRFLGKDRTKHHIGKSRRRQI